MEHKAGMMQAAVCERHSGAQPGGGVCAVCLQEKLSQLWRGEGNSNWNTEEYSVTPPPVQETFETPPMCEPSPGPDVPSPQFNKAVTPCFPVVFRVRNFHRDDVHESSKSSKGLEREKIDRSCTSGLDGDDGEREHQFSCEIKSIMKELAAFHEKKRSEKGAKKRLGSENASSLLVQRQQQEAIIDVSQEPVPHPSGVKDTDAAPADTELQAKSCTHEEEEYDDDDDDRYQKETFCFNAMRPGYLRAKLNLKWAKVLTNPIMSSNRIAPSKSDLLSKTTHLRPKIAAEAARADSGRDCETSGVLLVTDDVIARTRSPGHQIMPSPDLAPLPPRYVLCATDEDASAAEIDKEAAMRLETSRINVIAWLQSLPSPKTAPFKIPNQQGLPDDLSLGNGVLEMCDEEEVEFERQRDSSVLDPKFYSTDVFNHISSFGKFLLSSPQHRVLTRFGDMKMTAQ